MTSHAAELTSSTADPAGGVSAHEVADEPRARFTDLLAAEWLKIRTVRSMRWWALAGAVLVIGINANGARSDLGHWTGMDPADRAYFRRIAAPLSAFDRGSAVWFMLILCAFGAVAILNETTTGMIRATLTAVPARREMIAAKVLTVTALATGFGVLVTGVSFWLTQMILTSERGGVSITAPGALRRVVVATLLGPVSALVGLALGALIRHSVGTMVALFAVVFFPAVFLRDDQHLTAVLSHALIFRAWDRLNQIGDITGLRYPWTSAGAWTVYAVWSVAAIALTVVLLDRRDQ